MDGVVSDPAGPIAACLCHLVADGGTSSEAAGEIKVRPADGTTVGNIDRSSERRSVGQTP